MCGLSKEFSRSEGHTVSVHCECIIVATKFALSYLFCLCGLNFAIFKGGMNRINEYTQTWRE